MNRKKKNWKEGFFWNFHRCRIIGNICYCYSVYSNNFC